MNLSEMQCSEDMMDSDLVMTREPIQDPYARTKCKNCPRKLQTEESKKLGLCAPCRGKGIGDTERYSFGRDQREDDLKTTRNNPRI